MRPLFPALSLLFALTACEPGDPPFRMVQFCLAGVHEIDAMKATFRSAAAANGLRFEDRSAETEAELERLAAKDSYRSVGHPTINLGAWAPDGTGFGVTNFDEAVAQIVVGFSIGSDSAVARASSDAIVREISKRWRVHEVPNAKTSGAFPLADCS